MTDPPYVFNENRVLGRGHPLMSPDFKVADDFTT